MTWTSAHSVGLGAAQPKARLAFAACVALAAIGLLFVVGCASDGGGELSLRSNDDSGRVLKSGFESGLYRFDDKDHLTILLFDGPIEAPTQAVTIRLFWTPQAGKTPVDATATNATINYVIFTGDGGARTGIYTGAGFVYPKNAAGGDQLEAGVWDATLLLRDSTTGFNDLLGQAVLRGGFNARRDDAAVNSALRKLNVLVHQRLGYPRMVAEPGGVRPAM